MKQVFSISLAVVLCAVLIFSCTSNIELPPSPNDLFSSGGSSSSSDAIVHGNCPESVKNFTCSWQPSTVISGDNSKITFEYTAPSGTTCTGKVWKPLSDGVKTDTVYFPLGTDIKTAGSYLSLKNGGTGMSEESVSWPIVIEPEEIAYATRGKLSCTGDCTVEKACEPLTIKGAPAPEYAGKVTFDNYSYSSASAYYSGRTPTITSTITSISNNDKAKCTKIKLEIAGGTYNQFKEANIPTAGTISLTTHTGAALPAVDEPLTLTAKVIAICQGGNYTLETATATLVPDLKLSGTCVWSTGKDDDENYVTTTGNGALPSGNILSNIYGRCGSITGDSDADNSYELQTKDYSGNGYNPWPNTGKVSASSSYNDVKPNITCTPAINPALCPSLNVVEADVCDGKTNIANYCPGTEWSDVEWGTRIQSSGTPAGCYFVNFTSLLNNQLTISTMNNSTWRVNGTPAPSGSSVLVSTLNKKDYGYYIYLQTATQTVNSADNIYALEKPFCAIGIRKLTCGIVPTSIPTSVIISGSSVTQPSVFCNDGETPTDITFTGTGSNGSTNINFANIPAKGIYTNIKASATCKDESLTAACSGSMDVWGNANVTLNFDESYPFENKTVYNLTLQTPIDNRRFYCYSTSGNGAIITINSQEISIPNWPIQQNPYQLPTFNETSIKVTVNKDITCIYRY
jgi:hypothetical protein